MSREVRLSVHPDQRPSAATGSRSSNSSDQFTTLLLTLELTPGFMLIGEMGKSVQIGMAARLAALSIDTIRFYQRLGLTKIASRSTGGYRLFDADQIRELKFIQHAQELGFSLAEIKDLLALRQRQHACPQVQAMLEGKLASVREKIKNLTRLEAELAGALRNCNRELRLEREIRHEDCCPLLTKLDAISDLKGQGSGSRRRKSRDK